MRQPFRAKLSTRACSARTRHDLSTRLWIAFGSVALYRTTNLYLHKIVIGDLKSLLSHKMPHSVHSSPSQDSQGNSQDEHLPSSPPTANSPHSQGSSSSDNQNNQTPQDLTAIFDDDEEEEDDEFTASSAGDAALQPSLA